MDTTTVIEYAGLTIREGAEGKWHVLDSSGMINVLPGATFAGSEQQAMMLADVYLAADKDPQRFWHLLRAIQRATGTLR